MLSRRFKLALFCLTLASTYGKRVQQQYHEVLAASHAASTAMPGSYCPVKTCCQEMGDQMLTSISEVFAADHSSMYGYARVSKGAPACGLLGSVPDIGNNDSGPCGSDTDDTILDVLKKYNTSHSSSVVGAVLEVGTCEQWRGPDCWETATRSGTGYDSAWRNDMEGLRGSCSSRIKLGAEQVSWSMGCTKEPPYGLKFRALWNAQEMDDLCAATAPMMTAMEKVIESWTHDDEGSSLPGWVCMDIPAPHGDAERRLLAYSFGPPPCIPPSTLSTTEGIKGAKTVATTTGSSAKSSCRRAAELAASLSGIIALSMLSLAA